MKKSVVILGAGVAGLRAASALNERGYEVTVIERSPMAGGCTSSWTDNRDPEKRFLRKGQMQMVFPFYENFHYFVWKEFLARLNLSFNFYRKQKNQLLYSLTGYNNGFYFVDENGKRTHLSDTPQSLFGKALHCLPAPFSALQILWDFEGLPSLRDKASAFKFHVLAMLFGDRVAPPISDDFNFYGLCRYLGMTHEAIKAFRRITYSITNLSDADQVGPKFLHLFTSLICGIKIFSDVRCWPTIATRRLLIRLFRRSFRAE